VDSFRDIEGVVSVEVVSENKKTGDIVLDICYSLPTPASSVVVNFNVKD
jgi:hypothetical protein